MAMAGVQHDPPGGTRADGRYDAATGNGADRRARLLALVGELPDPEIPVVTLADLGILRDLTIAADGSPRVVLTPTYSGCPATEAIERSVVQALDDAGLGPVAVSRRLAPPWTTDWISPAGREKLRAYGIAPPGHLVGGEAPLHFRPRSVHCPRCDSGDTERLSAFGSTACKALYRCRACREPFEHFKPI